IAPRWGYHLNPEPNPTRYGKDAPWKSPKAGFSTALGNPAKCAGFPLFHSDHDCYMSKPKNQNRTFHLLRKADILTCYEQTRVDETNPRHGTLPQPGKCALH